ncbi:C39 family peptidase [Massilia aerilata]|uniref:C39 family peptidase n=1 Tax=Massilia aerilata TaxID=453817 RepID=A0ABW0S6K9_9BURK
MFPTSNHGPPLAKTLPFAMEKSREKDWCWAATAVSVSRYYNPQSPWNQCKVADACLSLPCCHQPAPANCLRTYSLTGPLRKTANLNRYGAGSASLQDVETEINNGRPVCCHVKWRGKGGHFVAIVGYDLLAQQVIVEDPKGNVARLPYAVFCKSYSVGSNKGGVWDYTYYTQP